ncbi:Docking protein 2-like protein [Leptotrombidium deliense]|uniref:Docking protein 2-like protein n=1 Tax=Leptotrombidium deliense TaxID=299467 RepID=A0A443SQV9_9ACAR|nr:Docking protein 2-like protein [Leptotrombidium deliense]
MNERLELETNAVKNVLNTCEKKLDKKKSRSGIERLEVFDSEDSFIKQSNKAAKIIALNECHKVTSAPHKNQPNVFENDDLNPL